MTLKGAGLEYVVVDPTASCTPVQPSHHWTSAAAIGDRAPPGRAPMDWLAFSLAGMRGSLDPYASVFLLTQAHWRQDAIGAVLTISGMLGITLHVPLGALIDSTHRKRGLMIAGMAALAASALAIAATPSLPVVLVADSVMAIVGGILAPSMAAIALGLVGRQKLPWRLGRNAAFDRAGNLFAALVAGAVGYSLSQGAVFLLVPLYATLGMAAVLWIKGRAIDHDRARGLDVDDHVKAERPLRWDLLLRCRLLLILAVVSALFHFANAPTLFMLGQKLALANPGLGTVLTSAAVISAQIVTIPAALLIGARADRWGRKPFLVVALIALPLRAVLLAVSDDPVWLIATQTLDGLGVGVFDAILPLVLADIMRGTGRYNVGQGLVGTVQGVGGSLSNAVAGVVIVHAGYGAAFLILGAIALVPLFLVLATVPETREKGEY
jgi:MFS family permease